MPETIEVGELLSEVTAQITGVTDYGVSLEALATGTPPPPEGARIDVTVEGSSTGRLAGAVVATDYLTVRADGRGELHIHGTITAAGGAMISFFADGVATPDPESGLQVLREQVRLQSSAPEYAWVNQLPVWGRGTIDPVGGELKVSWYVA